MIFYLEIEVKSFTWNLLKDPSLAAIFLIVLYNEEQLEQAAQS